MKRPPSPRGRPRSTESQRRILTATVALLDSRPWPEITVEAIAAKAKVSKQTIYKWWGGRPGLVIDAYLSSMQARVPAPDTGDLRRDLVRFLRRSGKVLRTTNAGRTLAAIIAESQFDPAIAEEFRERFLAVRRETLRALLERGVQRRELRPDLDLDLVMDFLYGVFWYRLLIQSAPLNDAFVEGTVGLMLRAIGRDDRRRS